MKDSCEYTEHFVMEYDGGGGHKAKTLNGKAKAYVFYKAVTCYFVYFTLIVHLLQIKICS
jgi:hypothetical protein